MDGRVSVRRQEGEEYLEDCMVDTAIGVGGSVMVWGAISYNYKTPLHIIRGQLNGACYQNEILQPLVLPLLDAHRDENILFMDDNAPCHRSRQVNFF